jgi:hypothetical protein
VPICEARDFTIPLVEGVNVIGLVHLFAMSLVTVGFVLMTMCAIVNDGVIHGAIFTLVFLAWLSFRRKRYFWRWSFVLCSLAAMTCSFTVFGGFEPNTEGAIATGKWLGVGPMLFVMFSLAAIASLISAFYVERQRRNEGGE